MHGRFVNVRTGPHTIIARSRRARSTDIVGSDNIAAIGTITGSTIAARWIISDATPSSQSFSTTLLERIAAGSECRVVMGTVDVVAATAITIKTASGTHFSVTTSPRTTMTYETTEHVSDLSQADKVAISGSPDPSYSNVILATLIRIDGANAYTTCREK